MLGKIEGRRRRGQQRVRLLDGITDESEQVPGVGDGQETWRAAVHAVTKGQTQLRD